MAGPLLGLEQTMRRLEHVFSTFLGAVVLTTLVACAGRDDADEPETAQAQIGAAGGTVAFADGRLTLVVPAGALAANTSIVVTELAPGDVPANLRSSAQRRVYRLEPAGTQFAVPVTVTAVLPPSAQGVLAAMLLESNGNFEYPGDPTFRGSSAKREVSGTIGHFSHVVVEEFGEFTATLTLDAVQANVGSTINAAGALRTTAEGKYGGILTQTIFNTTTGRLRIDTYGVDPAASSNGFSPGAASLFRMNMVATCINAGDSGVVFRGVLLDPDLFAEDPGSRVGWQIELSAPVSCVAGPATGDVIAVGLFNIPGLTALDTLHFFRGPFADVTATGPLAAVSAAEGVKVLDLVTRQVVLDRTAAGPDGATLGTSLLGAIPVAQAASAGAPAAMIGFSNTGASVQNWNATNNWGASIVDAEPTFDAVSAGGELVANTVALVRPVRGIDFVVFDGTANAYRIDPARFAPYSAFVGTGNLVSAQMVDAASGDVLVLGRAAGASISTSTKVFYKAQGDAQATTLLSMGNVDARRLRCIPVGTKQACVATLFSSGQGRAFLFDPASPRATPGVIVLTAAAGTLGVAQTLLPNGHVFVAMANFTANSLSVAELSADLVTIHSLNTIPAPAGCRGTAHVALVTDSEGLKAVTTCNGTNNYWVVKLTA